MSKSVTAVIPCHNHASWISGAIDSILAQDYENKRIVVVDDGSTDESSCVVESRIYRPKKTSFTGLTQWYGKVLHHNVDLLLARFEQGHGPSFARNAGIKMAWDGTDIFALLDSDDLYESGKISQSVARFEGDPQIGVVYTDFDTLRPDGLRLRQYKEPFSRERLLAECLVNCDSLVSKAAFASCGLFDESLRVCEDFDLWLRISERFLLSHLPESLVAVRIGGHSSTVRVDKQVWDRCYARIFQKLQERQCSPSSFPQPASAGE